VVHSDGMSSSSSGASSISSTKIENLCHPSRTLQQQGTAKVCILQFSNSFFAAQAWCVEERRGVKPHDRCNVAISGSRVSV